MKRSPKKMRMKIVFLYFLLGPLLVYGQDNSLYPSLSPGKKAPVIKGRSASGEVFRLSKVKSKYTLLYFYEVNCHLCAVVTPELKKLYSSYKKLGIEVVAIPLETNSEEWKTYIQELDLNWINIYPDTGCIGKLKEDYKLTVSPTMYLLDRKKILVAHRLGRIEHLEEELNRRIR